MNVFRSFFFLAWCLIFGGMGSLLFFNGFRDYKIIGLLEAEGLKVSAKMVRWEIVPNEELSQEELLDKDNQYKFGVYSYQVEGKSYEWIDRSMKFISSKTEVEMNLVQEPLELSYLKEAPEEARNLGDTKAALRDAKTLIWVGGFMVMLPLIVLGNLLYKTFFRRQPKF